MDVEIDIATEDAHHRRHRRLSLLAVITTSYGVGLSWGLGFPITALTFEAWHEPKWILGLASAVPAVGVLAALMFVTRLVNKFGPVKSIICGCLLGASGFLLMFLFQSAWAWIAVRLAMSACLAVPWLASETWINTVSRDGSRGRVVAAYATTFFLGFTTGPILLRLLGTTGPLPFIVAAMAVGTWALPIYFARKFAPVLHFDDRNVDTLSIFRLSPTAFVGAFISGFAEVTCLALVPNVALALGHTQEGALMIASIITVGGIVLLFPIGWLADKISRLWLLFAIAAVFVFAILLLPVLLVDPVVSWVLAFVLGGAILGFYAVGLALIGEKVPPAALAAANVVFLIAYQLGAIVGPLASGFAMTAEPVVGFVVTMVTLMTGCGLAALLMDHRGRYGR